MLALDHVTRHLLPLEQPTSFVTFSLVELKVTPLLSSMTKSPHLAPVFTVKPDVNNLTLVSLFSREMLAKLSHFWAVLLAQPDLMLVNLNS